MTDTTSYNYHRELDERIAREVFELERCSDLEHTRNCWSDKKNDSLWKSHFSLPFYSTSPTVTFGKVEPWLWTRGWRLSISHSSNGLWKATIRSRAGGLEYETGNEVSEAVCLVVLSSLPQITSGHNKATQ